VRPLAELWVANLDFIAVGGNVLLAILVVTFVMWTLIMERYLYFRIGHRRVVAEVERIWRERREHSSWHAHQIRKALVSRVRMGLTQTLPFVKTAVALAPLLGLLGTVTGMIEVFDVMAVAGSGNPRAMASGVSKATIPTMAGMVAALSGIIFSVRLQRRARSETEKLADRLSFEV
jgi:biopolymer transport protein ExbB